MGVLYIVVCCHSEDSRLSLGGKNCSKKGCRCKMCIQMTSSKTPSTQHDDMYEFEVYKDVS